MKATKKATIRKGNKVWVYRPPHLYTGVVISTKPRTAKVAIDEGYGPVLKHCFKFDLLRKPEDKEYLIGLIEHDVASLQGLLAEVEND